jgi:phage terminase large subunit-like protein
LRHSKGRKWAGKPFILEPWERDDIVMPLFGWKRADGNRRFRLAYITMGKKNGKSTLCAGIGLYLLAADGEPSAEVFSAAADRHQASIVFDEASKMVMQAGMIRKRFNVIPSKKRILRKAAEVDNSCWEAISADAFLHEGYSISGLIFDELHTQPNRKLWDALRYGGAARDQPLLISITTAGFDRMSICWEQYTYALGVLAGTPNGGIDDTAFFAYIAECPEDADWTDEANWALANPNLGVSIQIGELREMFNEARNSPAKENTFRRRRLNQWTEQEHRWLRMEKWALCEREYTEDDLAGRKCWAGLDLASKLDLTALVLLFPDDEDDTYHSLAYCWAPKVGAGKRAHADKAPYLDWARDGHLTLTEGEVTDYEAIIHRLKWARRRFDLQEVGFDPNNAGDIVNRMTDDGFQMVEVSQTTKSMNDPAREFERLIISGDFHHNGHPGFAWCVRNVSVVHNSADDIRPVKTQGGEKIDIVVAAIIALRRCMVRERGAGLYENHGIQFA